MAGSLFYPQRLWLRQTHPHGSLVGAIRAAPEKIGRTTPDTPGPPPAMPGPGPPPRRPQKPPGGRTGGRICKPSRRWNGPRRATGDAIQGNGWDANATSKRRKAAGRKKNKAWCNFTRKKKMQHRAATEATRKEERGTAAGQQNAPAGEDPTRAKRNPPEALPPAGMNYLSRALSTAPQKISA